MNKALLLFLCSLNFFIYADNITIYNKADYDIFLGVYYQKEGAQRVGSIYHVPTQNSIAIERPDRKSLYNRELVFDIQENQLAQSFDVQQFEKVGHINIGNTKGSTFYVIRKGNELQGYNVAQWKLSEPIFNAYIQAKQKIAAALESPLNNYIKSELQAITQSPYKSEKAIIRCGNELSAEEKSYRTLRQPKVKAALENLLGQTLADDQIPVCALIESGGGYRAMTCAAGWHVGAQEIGLLDAMTYMVGLSGSTWALNLWTSSGLTAVAFKDQLLPKMNDGLKKVTPDEFKLIVDQFLVKFVFDQPLTIVDLYGGLLANALLIDKGDMRQRIYLSQQAERVKDGDWIYPIYTAVRGDKDAPQQWYEFTPHEMGATWLERYVPSWAFGRKFDNGVSTDFAPEQSLGYMMGLFGSAFCATFNEMYAEFKDAGDQLKPPFDKLAQAILNKIGDDRIETAQVNNFSYGILPSPLNSYNELAFVDGGLEFNLPYPPVSGKRPGRKADVLIFLDASSDAIGTELQSVEKYARDNNLKFPVIDYTNIAQNSLSIFKDENDPHVPVVLYLPLMYDASLIEQALQDDSYQNLLSLINNFDVATCESQGYCNTFNFTYNLEQAERLAALTQFNMQANKDKIFSAIAWKCEHMA